MLDAFVFGAVALVDVDSDLLAVFDKLVVVFLGHRNGDLLLYRHLGVSDPAENIISEYFSNIFRDN